ncbi:MAG: GrpB family protein [Candidatus Thorarchaeota archaeon]|nr:GrpB family protein [Candidatus Thorarchaeota archaeon]
MVRKIEIVPYNPEWPIKFEEEAELIHAILGNVLVEIHHVGSTAIPGMSAKPIIGMLPVVNDIQCVEEYNPQFIEEGYEPRGELGLPGRRYFSKGGDEISHHLHIYQVENPEIERHLAFRDYMIVYPNEVQAYEILKKRLARKFPSDINAYCDGKDAFIKERERRALAWKENL